MHIFVKFIRPEQVCGREEEGLAMVRAAIPFLHSLLSCPSPPPQEGGVRRNIVPECILFSHRGYSIESQSCKGGTRSSSSPPACSLGATLGGISQCRWQG